MLTEQTATGDVPFSAPEFDFGSYREMVHQGELRRNIGLCFDFRLDEHAGYSGSLRQYLEPFADLLGPIRIEVDLHWNAPFSRAQIEVIRIAQSKRRKPEVTLTRRGPSSTRLDVPRLRLARTFENVPELNFRSMRFLASETNNGNKQESLELFLALVFDAAYTASYAVTHIGPLRDMPERAYRSEQAISPGGGSLVTLGAMQKDRQMARNVAKALRTVGLATDVEMTNPAPGYFGVEVTEPETGKKYNLADVGFGVSQVLPILVSLASARPGSLVLIQQPELHLHPDAQGGLADALVDFCRDKEISLFVESHSEHILLRLQRRIAARDLDPDEVAVYIADKGRVKEIEIDQMGRLDTSVLPKGFFEEEWEDALLLAKAAAKRASEQ